MRKFLSLFAILIFTGVFVFAQNKTITGKVTDDNGNPLSDVSIQVKGTKVGTVSLANGTFSLSIPAHARILEFSSVGMEPSVAVIGNKTAININLHNSAGPLSEVVVVGYGTKSVRENTSAVSKLKGDKIADVPLPSFDQALSGKVAGVQINSTGGILGDGVAIRVRGINSLSNSSQPLIVIDGIPQISLTNLNGFNGGDGTRFNPLALINSSDIESFEVLKDAGATAIYGSRAANGVILITTKKGKKGVSKVVADVKYGLSNVSKLPQMLNGDDFIAINNLKSYNRFGNAPANTIAKESDINGDGVNDRTDWMKALYRQAVTNDYSISMSGGSDKSTYYGSVRYLTQEGTSVGNKLTQGQARLNLEITPKTWFKSGMEISYSKGLNNGILSDRFSAGSVVGWQAFPTVSIYNPKGPEGYNLTTTSPIGIMGWGNNVRSLSGTTLFSSVNPIAAQKLSRQNNTAQEIRGSFYGEIQPVKGIKFTSKFGVQYLDNFEDQYTSPYLSGLGQPYNGLVQDQDQQNKLWDWQNFVTIDKKIGTKHKIGLVAGSDYQKNDYFNLYTGAANFSDPFFKYIIDNAYSNVQPGTTTTLNLTGGNKTSSGIESYFGRLNYSFANKYFIEGSYRGDAYSGFGAANKCGYFPSVSAAWEVTKENFMQSIPVLNYLKLRGSYGTVGNSRGIGEYAARQLYGGATYAATTGLGNFSSGNAGLRWETSKKTDIGFDAGLFKSRVNIIFDYFKNNIDNLVLNAPVLYTVGVPNSSIPKNIGSMYNKGYEITINATPVQTRNFTWTTSFNYSYVSNKITSLVPENGNADIKSGFSAASVGKPLGIYFLPNWAGVDAATGNPMWYSAAGTIKRYNFGAPAATLWTDEKGVPTDALLASDYRYQTGKSGIPKWYGGFDNNFRYHEFELSITTIFQGGNYLYNQTKAVLLSNSFLNNSVEIKNAWTKPGDITNIPRLFLLDNQANVASTRFLEKGDFIKIRTISFAYNASRELLSKIGVDNIRLSASIFNPFTITKYSGADPEVNTNRFDNIAVGTDLRNVPQNRTITVGVQVSF